VFLLSWVDFLCLLGFVVLLVVAFAFVGLFFATWDIELSEYGGRKKEKKRKKTQNKKKRKGIVR
jgi:mannose/fructose/N-acetylgalactosamine-specific phosphotransferase system component IIC